MNNGATGLIRRIEERERRRIRRLQAPHLVDLYHQLGMIETNALRAIDAATRAPKKARTK